MSKEDSLNRIAEMWAKHQAKKNASAASVSARRQESAAGRTPQIPVVPERVEHDPDRPYGPYDHNQITHFTRRIIDRARNLASAFAEPDAPRNVDVFSERMIDTIAQTTFPARRAEPHIPIKIAERADDLARGEEAGSEHTPPPVPERGVQVPPRMTRERIVEAMQVVPPPQPLTEQQIALRLGGDRRTKMQRLLGAPAQPAQVDPVEAARIEAELAAQKSGQFSVTPDRSTFLFKQKGALARNALKLPQDRQGEEE